MLASAEIVSVPLSAQDGAVGKSKAAGSYYSIDLAVGTPGQTVPVKFDTGSSELWVNPECDTSSNPAVCAAQGRFTESTTIDVLEGETGVIGGAQVQYATDYVRIGSATITQQIIGLGQSSKDAVVGVFGAGPQSSGFDSAYPTAIDSLAAQEFIGSRAFSLALKGEGVRVWLTCPGSVIFGGVDTQKYAGQLTKLAVLPGPNGEAGWFVKLDGISITKVGGAATEVYSGPGQTVLLDTGSSLSTLPPAIFASLLEAFPSAKLDDATGLHSVDCSGSVGSIDFSFADKVISVPVSDFVVNIPGSDLCVLGAFEGAAASAVLGDTFLKSVYAVFDFDNQAVHLAQAADCGSNLVAIGSGPAAVPSVEGCAEVARRSATVEEPETSPDDDLEWCDEEEEEEDDEEWCDDEDEDEVPTGHPTNTRGNGGHPTGGPGGPRPTGGPGGPHGPITRQTLTRTQFSTFTVTSCAPTVTNCHAGGVVTAVITRTTEVCPESTAVYT
ncbi:aspartic peptidase domain-containing protein, partial [Podospora conica]